MKTRTTRWLFAATLAGGVVTAQALPLGEHASVELSGGVDAMSGSFAGPRTTQDVQPGSIHFDRVAFDDAFHHRHTGGAELDYALDAHAAAFARFGYTQFGGATRDVAHLLNADATTTRVAARFGDTAARELDVGARYAFVPGARLQPFVGAALGAARVSPLRATVKEPIGAPVTVELARDGTLFTQRVETGLQYSPTRSLGVRLTVAADHIDGQRGSDDSNLPLLGLADTRGELRAHWDYPAELGAVWKF
jgi:hypothetical protein